MLIDVVLIINQVGDDHCNVQSVHMWDVKRGGRMDE